MFTDIVGVPILQCSSRSKNNIEISNYANDDTNSHNGNDGSNIIYQKMEDEFRQFIS